MGGYDFLQEKIHKNKNTLEICRIKNGFNTTDNNNSSGYRDLKINVLYKSAKQELNMIGEIQFLLMEFLDAKKKGHKLYSILREEEFYDSVVSHSNNVY